MGRTVTTLQDVAVQAGVSKTTAAAILRDAPGLRASSVTRQRVLETSKRLGYRRNAIAASLQTGRTHVIGVLLPLHDRKVTSYAQRAYPQELLVAVLEAATRAGLRVIPVPISYSARCPPSIPVVTDRHLDGLILAAIYDESFRIDVEEAGVPCVEISGTGPYRIHPDNQTGAAEAVKYLAQLGHQRIAHWTTASGYASQTRLAGFQETAASLGLEAWVVQRAEEMASLLSLPTDRRPTGIFAFNDYYACRALEIARQLKISVPESLSVVGFDDKILAETAVPPLTTICNPLEEQAEAAVQMLLCRLRGEEPVQPNIVVPIRLVVRSSTAAAPVIAS